MVTYNYKFSELLITNLRKAQSLSVLTGAGISAESGVPTFRGENGLWKQYRPEELATPEAFRQNPQLVWEWYEYRRNIILPLNPNPAHYAIVELEHLYKDFLLITQNVDGLHYKAGSRKLVELHGNIHRTICSRERIEVTDWDTTVTIPPKCKCGAYLRPDVVWFGESLPFDSLSRAYAAAREYEIMLVIGTSALVNPAASLPIIAKENGAFVTEINVQPTPLTDIIDESILGKAGEILPQLLENIKSKEL